MSYSQIVAQAGCTASEADPALLSAETLDWPSIAESLGSYATRLAVLSVDVGADDRERRGPRAIVGRSGARCGRVAHVNH